MNNEYAEKTEEKGFSWAETIKTILYALVIAITFRSFAFEPFHIPSASMKSTLLIGDYLFVSKYSYGYSRYSFPLGLPLFEGRVMRTAPQRGDIVVFRPPSQPRVDFIKRIIGMPGDSIQVKQGVLYINGKPLERRQLDDFTDIEDMQNAHSVARFSETLPEGKVITVLKERNRDFANNTPVYHVPEGNYFMMGDNRDNSHDSRFSDIGYIPEENIVGRAEMIFYSANVTISPLRHPVQWFQDALRYDRFFVELK